MNDIFSVYDKDIPTSLMISSMQKYGYDPEVARRLSSLLTLVDAAYDIIEVYNISSFSEDSLPPYAIEWKKQWLQAARECGAQPSP